MTHQTLSVDVLIFGGGVAGLWALDELRRAGYRVVLLEANGLGAVQTAACQGIIHGGLKYMFDGRLTPSASTIAEMPGLWRECMSSQRKPDLSGTRVRTDSCCIWGTGSIMSRLFMKGSTFALRTVPKPLEKAQWPAPLANVPGKVLHVGEQVIDTLSMADRFAQQNTGLALHIDPARVEFARNAQGMIASVRVCASPQAQQASSAELEIRPATVLLTAGEGNESLRALAALPAGAMQRRPLHMVMVRGRLPELYGHCVGGPKPRLTITSAIDSAGRCVWQVGGQIAEEGVNKDAPQLIDFARQELLACIPGLDLSSVEFAAYRINRAEAATAAGQRPDDVQLIQEGNVMTAWPTKLALAPRLAERILEALPRPSARTEPMAAIDFPAAPLALAPWEAQKAWVK